MPIHCPSCQSGNVKRFALVYADGSQQFNATSFSFGSDRRAIYTQVNGRIQSQASSSLSPPERHPVVVTIFGGFVLGIVLAAACTIANLLLAAFASWVFLPLILWLVFGILAGCAIGTYLAIKAVRFNKHTFPSRLQRWRDSFLCQVCGSTFVFDESHDDEPYEFGENSLTPTNRNHSLERGGQLESQRASSRTTEIYGEIDETDDFHDDDEDTLDIDEQDEATCRSLISRGIHAECRLADILLFGNNNAEDDEAERSSSEYGESLDEARRLYAKAEKRGQAEGALGLAWSFLIIREGQKPNIAEAKRWLARAERLGASEFRKTNVMDKIRFYEIEEKEGSSKAKEYENEAFKAKMDSMRQRSDAMNTEHLRHVKQNCIRSLEIAHDYYMSNFSKFDRSTQRELRQVEAEALKKVSENDWTEIDVADLKSRVAKAYAEDANKKLTRVASNIKICGPDAAMKAFGPPQ